MSRGQPIKRLFVKDVEYVAYVLAKKLMSGSEPIPDFLTRYPNRLESCLETPFQTFDKKALYRGLIKKAAILFYLMVKNHPFQNGNKRIAVTSLLTFLLLNKFWLKAESLEIYQFAKSVAESQAKDKDKIIPIIEKFVKIRLIKLN
jgi:death-on-curing family protein